MDKVTFRNANDRAHAHFAEFGVYARPSCTGLLFRGEDEFKERNGREVYTGLE
jgi:hypothetical protein